MKGRDKMRDVDAGSGLRYGAFRIDPPVVLAPMAGVTDVVFRRSCRRFGVGLAISEMVTAHTLVTGDSKSLRNASFDDDERPRSLQLYGVDPHAISQAVAVARHELGVDHIDLNFGCPMPKITRKGGGAAIPARPRLLASIVRAAVAAAGEVPVTIKVRTGLDATWRTWPDAGRIAQEEGCAAIGLHARHAAQRYEGAARWEEIARLVEAVSIPVLGNGDVWSAADALEMVRQTGCAGVIVGRACMGRPWIFEELAAAFAGRPPPEPPTWAKAKAVALEHARWMVEREGPTSVRAFRKHALWYAQGFAFAADLRAAITSAETLDALERAFAGGDPEARFEVDRIKRGRGKAPSKSGRVPLPEGFLQLRDDPTPPPPEAGLGVSGG